MPLGGGGTDLPWYYKKYGGFFISGAINKYMHIVVNRRFEPGIRVSYSQTEDVEDLGEIKHPSAREALKMLDIRDRIEIVSLADAPASTGLGSSGSFTVGLLNALYAFKKITKSPEEIAEEACDIAMNRLKEPSGKQDEYVASLGGIRAYEILPSGEVRVTDLKISDEIVAELESSIMMFYTGIKRSAIDVLRKQERQVSMEDGKAIERMHNIKRIGMESRQAIEAGDLSRFGKLLDEHWILKRGVTDTVSNDRIDRWYSIAKENGALGGKIMGAGGGGFLMIYCDEGQRKVRAAMAGQGLVEYRFRFDFEGSKVVHNV
ncbi:MAG TPA: hypothetical protein VN739_05260 [Nitrososphaerales archaeon]|nr:hypothetical protein [Nitrososphaerales archaeon]